MNICIPVEDNNGLDSRVCAHFGSAPFFLVVNSDTDESDAIVNSGAHHAHGMCQPLALLEGQDIDGVVVGGIGRGALFKFHAANIGVYLSEFSTVSETIAAHKSGSLRQLSQGTCAGHSHGHSGAGHGSGCGH